MSAAERVSKASRVEQDQRVSGASKRANGRASGPVLLSVFLAVLDHSGVGENEKQAKIALSEAESMGKPACAGNQE